MSVKIYKLLKSDLSLASEIETLFSSTAGMTISHYADGTHDSSGDIPFTVEGVDGLLPYMDNVEFCVAIQKTINLTHVGPNTQELSKSNNDLGQYSDDDKYKYVNKVPETPKQLPLGFKEDYKR